MVAAIVEYEAPSASISTTRARRASSERILRLRRRRSSSVRSSAVNVSAIWRAAYHYYFIGYKPLVIRDGQMSILGSAMERHFEGELATHLSSYAPFEAATLGPEGLNRVIRLG